MSEEEKNQEKEEMKRRDKTVDEISKEKPTVTVQDPPQPPEKPKDPKEYVTTEYKNLKIAQQQLLGQLSSVSGQLHQIEEMAKRMNITIL